MLMLPSAQQPNKALIVSNSFLPYLKFFYGMSDLCKQKKFPSDTFGMVEGMSDPQQLGEKVDVLFLAVRPLALDLSGEKPVRCNDMESNVYKSIKERADNGGYGSNCLYGPEFLIYLVGQDKLATFHLGNKSLRFLGVKIMAFLPQEGKQVSGATLSTEWVERAKVPFMGVKVETNNAIVLADPEGLRARIMEALPDFLNPPATDAAPVEKAQQTNERG